MTPLTPDASLDLATISDEGRHILQMLSVLYAGTPLTGVILYVQRCPKVFPPRAWTNEAMRRVLNGLTERGLAKLKNGRYACAPEVVELASRSAVLEETFETFAALAPPPVKLPVHNPWDLWYPLPKDVTGDDLVRDLRLAAYRRDEILFEARVKQFSPYFKQHRLAPLSHLALTPFDPLWLECQPPAIMNILVEAALALGAQPQTRSLFTWLEQRWIAKPDAGNDLQRFTVAWECILQGRPDIADALLAPCESPAARAVRAFVHAMRGQLDVAATEYSAALAAFRKMKGTRNDTFHGEFGMLHPLTLIANHRVDEAEKLITTASGNRKNPLAGAWRSLSAVVALARGNKVPREDVPDFCTGGPVQKLLSCAIWVWSGHGNALLDTLEARMTEHERRGETWLAAEYAEMMARANGNTDWRKKADEMHATLSTQTLLGIVQGKEAWERVLSALEAFSPASSPSVPARPKHEKQMRLIWLIGVYRSETLIRVDLTPREQKQTASGWTSGRPVALKRLHEDAGTLTHLTDADRRICANIQPYHSGYHGSTDYLIDWQKSVPHLIGHPLLFDEACPETRLEAVKTHPVLRVEQRGETLTLRLEPACLPRSAVDVQREGNVLRFVEYRENDLRLARILGESCHVPGSARSRVRDLLSALATRITIATDEVDSTLEEVAADGRLHVFLTPLGEGLKGRVAVRPCGDAGPLYSPGVGPSTLMGDVGGKPRQLRRDLSAEKARWEALRDACSQISDFTWDMVAPADCLEFLAALGETDATVHWPEGVRFKLARTLEWRDCSVRVARQGDWFTVGGDVPVDASRVLALEELIVRRQGRFVALGEGEFLALTGEFERRLSDLAALVDPHGKELRIHPVVAPLVNDALDGASTRADRSWKTHLQRFASGPDAEIPTTLQADLRDYQATGFRWLARLADWGAGACLADDMGVGKTLQALALLLRRAPGGPALVLAPTSVCANWLAETRRFAPTLRMRLHAGAARTLGDLGPFDVVVTSYALLVQDEKALTAVSWHTAVLDEAQAIKNATTRRSRAAMKLHADCRVITTGTPVENHLGELWNLFRFLNPGLLGSREQFETRFAGPIEQGDAATRKQLKRRISPFILRRTKTQVLEELPSRTEIVLQVELSDNERAIYETIRRNALQSIANEDEPQRMSILADLMRLRRACCHPRLVMGNDAALTSSKLDVFTELLDELLENRHKALVFSQFVDHLAVVRERLDKRGVRYQYLDGATSMKEREARVAAFQRGEGDVFLISLRAGGTGLNLTAADYVIHLDPWWNPAVEDQASDRAYRIGQQRPVTIYRLVAKDTVEERIVDLHHRKRDLADSLLEGTDSAIRLSVDDLIALLSADAEPFAQSKDART